MIACTHKWEPMAMLGSPAKSCSRCGFWSQVCDREFTRLFGYRALREARRMARRQVASAVGNS